MAKKIFDLVLLGIKEYRMLSKHNSYVVTQQSYAVLKFNF